MHLATLGILHKLILARRNKIMRTCSRWVKLCRQIAWYIPEVSTDQGESAVLLLEAQQRDGLVNICYKDQTLDAQQLMDVDLCVNERHTHQVIIL